MAQFHFVEDYERHVAHLLATHPLDEAMSLAVGGSYEQVGAIERDLLRWAGLADGMSLVDLGCGSGRLAAALGKSMSIEYLGIDIVQSLLDYAQSKTPANYRYLLNHALTVPAPDASADMVCAFSLFTHLLPSESYLYLEDIARVLKPDGRLVFTFIEFSNPEHWPMFIGEVQTRRHSATVPLNTFLDRAAIELWSRKLGYRLEHLIDGTQSPWGGTPMWQSTAILRKPAERAGS